ncbi:MAG: sigma-70 family RNA polymerase sigma factor [Saprospiraceae bacterium]|nr:sigma-70 family RNA polymerase sigma factor [Lewinella sp.]
MAIKTKEEEALWDAFRAGEKQAFSRLFFEYYEPLYHYGHRINPDPSLIKDVLQDFFLQLYENRAGLSPSIRNIKAYLLISFRRRLLQELQKQRQKSSTMEAFDPDDRYPFSIGIEDIIIAKESDQQNEQLLSQLLAELPPRQRELIYLKYYLGLSLPEMAETLEISYQVVANHLHRALKKLQGSETIRQFLKLDLWLLLGLYTLGGW